ncbi:MAG: hypothetical protein H6739_13950 [Alphaproteobacteria bacterium]|nr:hypothetical protein [Alphaproteobacteria bacterium]
MTWIALFAALSTPAAAVELGAQLAMTRDLPDPGAADPPAAWGFGPTLLIPARFPLGQSRVAVRAELAMHGAPGQVRTSWTEGDTLAEGVRADGQVLGAWALGGAEVSVPLAPGAPVRPYFGAGVGGGAVGVRLDDAPITDGALTLPVTDGAAGTRQVRWMASAYGGLSLGFEKMAFDMEVGYSLCHVPEAALRNTLPEAGAVRSTFGLNLFRIGAGVSVPLPSGGG